MTVTATIAAAATAAAAAIAAVAAEMTATVTAIMTATTTATTTAAAAAAVLAERSDDDDDDDDRIRAAVRGGEAAPLRDILAVVRKSYRGKIVNIRLTGSGSRLAYRIRMLDSANRLIEIKVNAKTRKITSVRKL